MAHAVDLKGKQTKSNKELEESTAAFQLITGFRTTKPGQETIPYKGAEIIQCKAEKR